MGWVNFEREFQTRGDIANQPMLVSENWSDCPFLWLCGIKISAVHHLVSSKYTRLTDRQTDIQNCDSNTVRCTACSRNFGLSNEL